MSQEGHCFRCPETSVCGHQRRGFHDLVDSCTCKADAEWDCGQPCLEGKELRLDSSHTVVSASAVIVSSSRRAGSGCQIHRPRKKEALTLVAPCPPTFPTSRPKFQPVPRAPCPTMS